MSKWDYFVWKPSMTFRKAIHAKCLDSQAGREKMVADTQLKPLHLEKVKRDESMVFGVEAGQLGKGPLCCFIACLTFFLLTYLMHMSILTVWMYVYHVCEVWYAWRSEDSIISTGTGVRDNSEPSCVCWEPDWTEPGHSERRACALISLVLDFILELRSDHQRWLEDDGRVKETTWFYTDVYMCWSYRQTLCSKWTYEAHTWFSSLNLSSQILSQRKVRRDGSVVKTLAVTSEAPDSVLNPQIMAHNHLWLRF